jgi:hypothetical protein
VKAIVAAIPLSDGVQLRTLGDAGSYIMALPPAAKATPQWQAAAEALLMAAEGRGPLMHARIGMLRALNRHVERVFIRDGKCCFARYSISRTLLRSFELR